MTEHIHRGDAGADNIPTSPSRPRRPYSREDLGSLPGTLAFAEDLAALKWDLMRAGDRTCCYEGGCHEPEAGAFLVLLEGLEAGQEPLDAIIAALHTWRDAREREREDGEARRERERANYERRMAEEEITRAVECPFCGSQPGKPCRTTGELRNMRTDSHRDRYRLARHLNDGHQEGANGEAP